MQNTSNKEELQKMEPEEREALRQGMIDFVAKTFRDARKEHSPKGGDWIRLASTDVVDNLLTELEK